MYRDNAFKCERVMLYSTHNLLLIYCLQIKTNENYFKKFLVGAHKAQQLFDIFMKKKSRLFSICTQNVLICVTFYACFKLYNACCVDFFFHSCRLKLGPSTNHSGHSHFSLLITTFFNWFPSQLLNCFGGFFFVVCVSLHCFMAGLESGWTFQYLRGSVEWRCWCCL